MIRNWYISGWEKPTYKWCECGDLAITSDETCGKFHIKGNRLEVPAFEIVANPIVRWNEVNRRRYTPIRSALQDISHEASLARLVAYAESLNNERL